METNLVNTIRDFLNRIQDDNRIGPVHISLFMAIVQQWANGNFENPVYVRCRDVMLLAKISASATYYRCINDLTRFGYIQYKPSHNCLAGSQVYLQQETEV